jgi:hypothetical protein
VRNVFVHTDLGFLHRRAEDVNGSKYAAGHSRFKVLLPPRRQATTWTGSPTLTWLKYHAALSGLRLMHP